MMTLKESIELVVRKYSRVSIVDKTTLDLVSEIKSVLLESGLSSVTVIDARTLYDKNDFRRMLNAVQDGILIINHATEVPESKHRDIINALIKACLKGDYMDVTEEWMIHFAETKIGVAAIVDKNDHNTPVFNEIFPIGGGCRLLAFTDDGYECF